MDENKPPEEPIVTPEPDPVPAPEPAPEPAPAPPSAASQAMSSMMADAPKGGPVPFSAPPDPSVPAEEKTQAMLSWVLMFFVSFISPLIFFLISTDKPFVKRHAATGLAMAITGLCIGIGMFVVGIILALARPLALLVIPLWGIISLAMLAVLIMGIIAANAGSRFDPPVISKIRDAIFKV